MVVKVFIRETGGKTTQVEVCDADYESCTVLRLREEMRKRATLRDCSQHLLINLGRTSILADAAKLSDYGIHHESVIFSFVKSTKITLFIEGLNGKIVDIRLDEDEFKSCQVEDLKSRIQDKEGIPEDQQRLIYIGRQLEDGRTLSDFNIQDLSIIHIALKLRGGGHVEPEQGGGGMGDKGGKNRSNENLLNFFTKMFRS